MSCLVSSLVYITEWCIPYFKMTHKYIDDFYHFHKLDIHQIKKHFFLKKPPFSVVSVFDTGRNSHMHTLLINLCLHARSYISLTCWLVRIYSYVILFQSVLVCRLKFKIYTASPVFNAQISKVLNIPLHFKFCFLFVLYDYYIFCLL